MAPGAQSERHSFGSRRILRVCAVEVSCDARIACWVACCRRTLLDVVTAIGTSERKKHFLCLILGMILLKYSFKEKYVCAWEEGGIKEEKDRMVINRLNQLIMCI